MAPGQRIGPYELGDRLGAGGMAEVYIARRAGPGGFEKKFAIKRILPQLTTDSRFVAMFCDEARICAALAHPNIVQVVDFGEHDGQLFMAMEYVEGISCARLLRAVAARGERFPPGAALFIAHEVLRALRFAHEARDDRGRPLRIVHRDVSPGNILLGRAGEVKLTDFGIVLSSFVDRRTYPGELKGKMGYMSPEQVIGDEVDRRSDLFSLGIVLAEMFLARPLFHGKSEMDMLTRMYEVDLSALHGAGTQIPRVVLELLLRALARDKSARFQRAGDFADAVQAAASRLGVPLNETQLLPWLHSLGVLPGSGTRPAMHESRPKLALAETGRKRPPPVRRRAPACLRPPVRVVQEPNIPSDMPPAGRAGSPRYQVVVGKNTVVGPLTLPQLLELGATGRLDGAAQIREEGGQFRPAAELTVLAHLLRRPAYRFREAARVHALWRRPLCRRWLPVALFEVARRLETGLLIARRGRHQKRIYFRGGAPEFVASTDREELLGVRLVRSGTLTEPEVSDALIVGARQGRRLGDVLTAAGRLAPDVLLRSLSEQLLDRMAELATWRNGDLAWVPAAEPDERGVRHRASGVAIVARAIHSGYEEAEIASLLGEFRSARLSGGPVRLGVSDLALNPAQLRALDLAPDVESLNALVSTLKRDANISVADTLWGVFMGLSCGLLRVPGWP